MESAAPYDTTFTPEYRLKIIGGKPTYVPDYSNRSVGVSYYTMLSFSHLLANPNTFYIKCFHCIANSTLIPVNRFLT